jgi:beta-lactamase class A
MQPILEILPLVEKFRQTHAGSQVWIAARNIRTGARFGLGEREPVRTASTIKLPILCALFEAAQEGRVRLDESIELRAEDKVSGSGVLAEFSGGLRLPLLDVARMMIVVSDNTGTNMILERLSADYVNECLTRWGFTVTASMRKIRGDGTALKAPTGFSRLGRLPENERWGIGRSSGYEMTELLERLARKQLPGAEQIIEILKRQQYKDGIGRRLDSRHPVASKSGALDALRSDVGLVYSPGGPIAIAITVDGMPKADYSPDNAANILIADISDRLVAGLPGGLV